MPPTEGWVKRALGRPEADTKYPPRHLGKVLVTGGEGSIGASFAAMLEQSRAAEATLLTDIDSMDVRDDRNVMAQFLNFGPTNVVHLAASKHAPLGEEDPYDVSQTNVYGTKNVLEWCRRTKAHCVVASTCKACDPETAYGATKLVAERMALNYGQTVVRYYNTCETSGNVFRTWEQSKGPLEYTECKRRFISLNEALALTMWCVLWGERGARYTLTDTVSQSMRDVLASVYPDSENHYVQRALRRGDRVEEPQHAASERMEVVAGCEWISRVWSPHDPHDRKE
jgi:FlaA1/EpsC-like NDP-sugar epimerase